MADETYLGEQPADGQESADAQFIHTMDGTINELSDLLQRLQTQENAVEAEEKQRAKTPLALRLELIGCEYFHVGFSDTQTMPEYTPGEIPCPFNKAIPDQECRDCSHVRFFPYGMHLKPHEKRYASHGMVIPIASEEEADALAEAVKGLDLKPLRRIRYEIQAVAKAINNAEARRQEAIRRETERQQGKRD
ncbi:MAG: hypothetical protein ACXWQ5_00185 [Ktedonobacterales bacterium]